MSFIKSAKRWDWGMKKSIIIHPEELTDNMVNRVIDCGVEVLGLHPVGGKRAAESLTALVKLKGTREFEERLRTLRAHGIAIEYHLHALSYFLPRGLFSYHPEWFRADACGQRINDMNMCPSNEEALLYVSERVSELTRILPSDTGKYYYWLDDIADAGCHCEKCMGTDPSDQAMLIFNAILKGIRKVDPVGKQCFLAYADQKMPPMQVQPEEGIFLQFAPMRSNTDSPFNENEENRSLLNSIRSLLDFFGRRDSVVLDYWLDNSLFSGWKKPPIALTIHPDVIRKDIAFYRACGFEEITTFACYLSDDYVRLYGEPPIADYIKCY